MVAFMHSRQWTGGASACWCTSFWLADRPSPLMEMRTRTQTLPSMDSPWSLDHHRFQLAFSYNPSTTLTISVSHITGGFQKRILLSPKIWDLWPKTSSSDSSSKIQRRDWAQVLMEQRMWKNTRFTRWISLLVLNISQYLEKLNGRVGCYST